MDKSSEEIFRWLAERFRQTDFSLDYYEESISSYTIEREFRKIGDELDEKIKEIKSKEVLKEPIIML